MKIKKRILIELRETGAEAQRIIDAEFPELFGVKLEVGEWYKTEYKGNKYLICLLNLRFNECFKGSISHNSYGFKNDEWIKYDFHNTYISRNLIEATPEEVKEALIREAKRRGFKVGNFRCLSDGLLWDYDSKQGFTYNECGYVYLLLDAGVCFKDGKWAEIIEDPKKVTLTLSEAIEKLRETMPGVTILIE